MQRIKLSDILEGMEVFGEEALALLDTESGQVVILTEEDRAAAEEGDPLEDYPEWQREAVRHARLIDQEGGSRRYLTLPDQFDMHEWEMMERFALMQDDARCERLLSDIRGAGAFRRFKDRIHELGLTDDWYEYRAAQYRQAAMDWAESHGLDVDVEA